MKHLMGGTALGILSLSLILCFIPEAEPGAALPAVRRAALPPAGSTRHTPSGQDMNSAENRITKFMQFLPEPAEQIVLANIFFQRCAVLV